MDLVRSQEELARAEGVNMARIKITELPRDQKISSEVMKALSGGYKLREGYHPQGRLNTQRQKSTLSTNPWYKDPWFLGAIVAGAIAVPLAIDDDSDDGA